MRLFVATTDVLLFQAGMSLSMRTTLTPFLIALSSSLDTAGLVGVIAMPFTPFATMSWIAAISPASSVALLPCAKITVASLCALSHFFAAFWRTKKKSTGNFVMNPSLTVASRLRRLGGGAARQHGDGCQRTDERQNRHHSRFRHRNSLPSEMDSLPSSSCAPCASPAAPPIGPRREVACDQTS